jgi:hypothetical protein
MISLDLPHDLFEFLAAGKQLEYDPATCESGAIRLLPLQQLKIELFPMYMDTDIDGLPEGDPHKGENGYYLVEGVNLVGECQDYEPCGLLMWLPLENCFATWDMDHWYIGVFSPEHTWSQIVKAPAPYINAQWVGAFEDSVSAKALKPWAKYRYSQQLVGSGPFPFSE